MDKLKQLQHRIKTDSDFRGWITIEWGALYQDIMQSTGLYPGFYDVIEKYYEEGV